MSMNLHNGSTHDGLFDLQGTALAAIDAILTSAGDTIPTAIQATIDRFDNLGGFPTSFETTPAQLPNALASWQAAGQSLAQTLAAYCQSVLAGFVLADSIVPRNNAPARIEYLIADMLVTEAYVVPNTVAGVLTPNAENVGDTAVAWTLRDGTGADLQNAYAETLTLTVGANPSATRPAIACIGQAAVAVMSPDWPAGSGASCTLSAVNPASSLVANGTFEDATETDIPDGWLVVVGAPGTTIKRTVAEAQTVAIGGTPTGGTYLLYYTDRYGNTYATAVLPYNATASQVQTALAALPGLADVTATAIGTTPNYTHTVTFNSVGGDVTQLTSTNLLTGGSPTISHGTTVAGDASDYRGVSLKLVGNSSTLHALYAPLAMLQTETVYFCHLRARRFGVATAAALNVAVVQEIGGAALDDTAGIANELAIDAEAMSDAEYTSYWFSFRLPATASSPVYLRIAATAAIPTGATVYLDEVAVTAGAQLYAGGPFAAAFSGRDAAAEGDGWTLVVINDHAGEWQDWYNRVFNMANYGLSLPTTGSALIDDALIA